MTNPGPLAFLETTRLLLRLSRPGSVPRTSFRVTSFEGPEGVFDRYAPLGRPRRHLLALHGVTLRGHRDIRLIQFAEEMARTGFCTWVPRLEGPATFSESPRDIESLLWVMRQASGESESPLAVVGFSLGAGIGLVAAADPRIRSKIGHFVAIGAHHDLDTVWTIANQMAAQALESPTTAVPDALYAALLAAHRGLGREILGPALHEQIIAILQDFCTDFHLENTRALVRDQLLPLWDPGTLLPAFSNAAQLSPRGHLQDVKAEVHLIHDPHDPMVPVAQAQANWAELKSRPQGQQELLITGLLDHVRPAGLTELRGVPSLVRAFAALR